MQFLKNLGSRLENVKTAFQKSMADKKVASHAADVQLEGLSKLQKLKTNPITRLNSKDGMIGERVQQGFGKSLVDAAGNEALAQVNPTHEKGLRNQGMNDKANSYDQTGTDYSRQRIEGYLDI